MPICFSKITMSPPCHCSTSHGTFLPLYRTRIRMLFQCTSSNLRNKKRLRKNPEAFCSSRRLPIFTRRFQRTILGTSELNFCVRNGNRWNLTVIVTDQYDWFSITFLFYFVQCFLKDVPSKLNNHCSHFVIDLRIQANCGQALDLLVHAC